MVGGRDSDCVLIEDDSHVSIASVKVALFGVSLGYVALHWNTSRKQLVVLKVYAGEGNTYGHDMGYLANALVGRGTLPKNPWQIGTNDMVHCSI